MPKLQAACTHAGVRTSSSSAPSATSATAAEGQNAVLEFILLNHPLDCPDCDKGGECPLQDLTFRFGPGRTRMHFPKRTFDKPIPISPTIALDRERCILCYRCTRFSEGISEDGQLVAKNRGANSIIATFEDEPYRAHFSGNVTELCPVGALLPDDLPLPRAALGDRQRADGLRPLPGRVQRLGHDARGEAGARPLPEPPGDRRRLALRQGPVRLRPRARTGPCARAARSGCDAAASSPSRGSRRWTRRSEGFATRVGRSWSRFPARRRTRRPGRSRRSCESGSRTRTPRRSSRTTSTLPSTRTGRRSPRSARPMSCSSSATIRSSSARRSSTSGSEPRDATAST